LLDVIAIISADSAPGTEILIENILVDNKQVGLVLRKGVIEFRSNFFELGETSPGNIGEIMVLNVISDIKVGNIKRPIIRVGILTLNEFVMFSNDVSSNGVQSEAKEGSENQICQSLRAETGADEDIPGDNDNSVDQFHRVGGFGTNKIRSECIEERHEEDIKELSESGVKELNFTLGRKIRVPVRSSEENVVVSVVSTEGDRRGDSLAHVGEDSSELVSFSRPEGSVMG